MRALLPIRRSTHAGTASGGIERAQSLLSRRVFAKDTLLATAVAIAAGTMPIPVEAQGVGRANTKARDNKAIVGRWFKEFWGNPWNPKIVDELAAPNMLLQYSLHAPRRGREDVKAFMVGFRAAYDTPQISDH